MGSTTLATAETDTGSSASASLTETLVKGSDLTQTGNDFTGQFSAIDYQTNTSTLNETGHNSHGSYTLLETTADSPTVHTTGDRIANNSTTTSSGDQTYAVHQYDSSGGNWYTLDETGDKSYSSSENFDATSGLDTLTETGTDAFTINQHDSYGLTQVETGADGYTQTDTDNLNNGNFDHLTTGTGNYTLTDTGSSTGTHTYSGNSLHQEVTGDGASGKISESQTGDTRYSKLSIYGTLAFNDPSDAGSGLSGVTGLSAVGAMVQVEGYFPAATGSPSSVGDAAYKYCFAKGTLVMLVDGTSKAIEKLENGQEVLALPEGDPQAHPRACRIVQVFHNAPARIFDLKVAGEVIRTTAGHPFYVKGKGWVKVRDLAKGDELRTDKGAFLKVQSIVDSGKTEPVFNLEVQGDHTYFVRLPESGRGVWVHNQSFLKWLSDTLELDEYCRDMDEGVAALHDGTESAASSIEDASMKSGNSGVAAVGGFYAEELRTAGNMVGRVGYLVAHPAQAVDTVIDNTASIMVRNQSMSGPQEFSTWQGILDGTGHILGSITGVEQICEASVGVDNVSGEELHGIARQRGLMGISQVAGLGAGLADNLVLSQFEQKTLQAATLSVALRTGALPVLTESEVAGALSAEAMESKIGEEVAALTPNASAAGSAVSAPGTAVPQLPAFNGVNTEGVLITNEGQVIPLGSGNANPIYANYPAASHVEGKAAIWIRENGSTGGIVYHNNPSGICGFCNAQVPTLLLEGTTLQVVGPAGTVSPIGWYNNDAPYFGNSAIPKPNLRLGGNP